MKLTALAALLFLPACSSLQPRDFAGGRPVFDPTEFFTGKTQSSGLMQTRGGAPIQRVTTETRGEWHGDVLHLEQDLVLGAEKLHRSWRIRRVDAHHFTATANDMIGRAEGEAWGDVFHWSFTLALTPGNPLGRVRMSQWMVLQPDGRTMVNHSSIRKFGVEVAQVTEQFRRVR